MGWPGKKTARPVGLGVESPINRSLVSLAVSLRSKRWTPWKKPLRITATTSSFAADQRNSLSTQQSDDDGSVSILSVEPRVGAFAMGTAPTKKSEAWDIFKTVLKVANEAAAGIPPVGLKAVIGTLIAVIDKFEAANENREAIKDLTRHIKRLQETVINPLKTPSDGTPHKRQFLTTQVNQLARELESLTSMATNRMKQSKTGQWFGSSRNTGVIQQMNKDLERALALFQTETIVEIANRLEISAQKDIIARSLPCAHGASYDSGLRSNAGATSCLPGTQEATLRDVESWILAVPNPTTPPIFWVWGMAGTGKSTLAHTVAAREDEQGRLGASFFFSRDAQEQRNSLLLFSTLAFQLSGFHAAYRYHLAEALERDPRAGHTAIDKQLDLLLVRPLLACASLPTPIVIVIDALDECEPESAAETIIHSLGMAIQKLDRIAKIIITSRQEQYLHSSLRTSALDTFSKNFKFYGISKSDVSEADTRRDIKHYLDYHLHRIASRPREPKLPEVWPEDRQKEILARKAGTLFIVAATLIKFIDSKYSSPATELNALTEGGEANIFGPEDTLITMYNTIIIRALPPKSSPRSYQISKRVRMVVETIVLIKNPMSADALTGFLEGVNVSEALTCLHSLIAVPSNVKEPIRVLHQSFPEYLLNPDQCDERIHVDPAQGHTRLAALCLKHLSSLQRNPCDIDDPARTNKDVLDLSDRIDRHILVHRRYSCLHFADHIASCFHHDDKSLTTLFCAFCESNLLAWIEALSYLGRLDVAVTALKVLREWYEDTPNPSSKIKELIRDAQRLLDRFFNLIQDGAGQIYLTALPWVSPSTLMAQYEILRSDLRLPCEPSRDCTLERLADNLLNHYHTSKNTKYLTEAISLNREALQSRPVGHTLRASSLNSLANCLTNRYRRMGDLCDVMEAAHLYKAMLELDQPENPEPDLASAPPRLPSEGDQSNLHAEGSAGVGRETSSRNDVYTR